MYREEHCSRFCVLVSSPANQRTEKQHATYYARLLRRGALGGAAARVGSCYCRISQNHSVERERRRKDPVLSHFGELTRSSSEYIQVNIPESFESVSFKAAGEFEREGGAGGSPDSDLCMA